MALRNTLQRSGLSETGSPERNLSVLVVEDNALVRRMTSELLTELGCEVTTVGNGAAARAALGHADAVIIDVGLPDCSGADLIEEMRWNDATLPVIVATAYVDKELRARFANDARTQLLAKPFTEEQLRRAVDRLKTLAETAT